MADDKVPVRDAARPETTSTPGPPPAAVQIQRRPFSWGDFDTWSLSMKFFPVYVALLGIFVAVYYNYYIGEGGLELTSYETCSATFNYTFPVNAVLSQSQDWSKLSGQSWEIAYAFEATQQVYNPERSVFASGYLPNGKPPSLGMRMDEASLFAHMLVKYHGKSLKDDDNVTTVAGPASLGIVALQLGQRWSKYLTAVTRQKDILLEEAPRWRNGAISYLYDTPQLQAEAMYMFPPFLAYAGAVDDNLDLMREAVRQCGLYRDALQITTGSKKGLWRHKIGSSDALADGAWSTANAAAAYGMAKVRATIAGWPKSNAALHAEKESLDTWITEILDAVIRTDDDSSELLRNYLGDKAWSGETTGTALVAAAAYRMKVISPTRFASRVYHDWADRKRRAVVRHLDGDGFARPAANPYQANSRENVNVSPEGESYVLLLGTALRDCVCAGVCLDRYLEETGTSIMHPTHIEDTLSNLSFEKLTGVSFQKIYKYFQAPGATLD